MTSGLRISQEGVQLEAGPSQTAATRPIESLLRTATLNMGLLPRLRLRGTGKDYRDSTSRNSKAAVQWDLAKSIPLKDLIPLLTPVQRSFFEKLDGELDKVEAFYVEREKEMRTRLVSQLMLDEHGAHYLQPGRPHSRRSSKSSKTIDDFFMYALQTSV